MIRQPDFITEEMFKKAYAKVKRKKHSVYIDDIRFQIWPAETCVQVLHIGAFDDELKSFAKLDAFVSKHGISRTNDTHREVYLNNAKRVSKDKLQTILRYTVQ